MCCRAMTAAEAQTWTQTWTLAVTLPPDQQLLIVDNLLYHHSDLNGLAKNFYVSRLGQEHWKCLFYKANFFLNFI